MFSFLIERSGQPEKCLAGCRNSIIFAYDGFVNTSQQFNITISHYDKPAAKAKKQKPPAAFLPGRSL